MHDIDFLPAQYRQQNLRRQSQPWRIVVVLAFVALLVGAGYSQQHRHGRVEADLKAIQPQYQEAIQRQERLAEMQTRLFPVRASAELIAFLRHPWPRTQLLAAVVGPLPEEITLEQLDIRQVTETKTFERRDAEKDEKEQASLPPAARDLELLREECNDARTVVVLLGRTRASAAVHEYLSQLAGHALIAKVELESMENVDRGEVGTLEFQATLLVRRGYGQPGGPAAPANPEELAEATATGRDESAAPLTPEDAS